MLTTLATANDIAAGVDPLKAAGFVLVLLTGLVLAVRWNRKDRALDEQVDALHEERKAEAELRTALDALQVQVDATKAATTRLEARYREGHRTAAIEATQQIAAVTR